MSDTWETDFMFHDHGSIWLMVPQNDVSREHAVDVLPDDTPTFGAGYAIEPRCVTWIVESLRRDGFICDRA